MSKKYGTFSDPRNLQIEGRIPLLASGFLHSLWSVVGGLQIEWWRLDKGEIAVARVVVSESSNHSRIGRHSRIFKSFPKLRL